MSPTPHDALVKDVYSNPRAMASLLRQTLPPRALARLDLGTLRLLPGTYISEALRETRTDLLFEATGVEGVAVRIYTLFEHRSTPKPFTALDLLRYQVDIWQDFLKQNPRADALPAIVPLVLYHGQAPWTAPRDFAALVDLSREALEDLRFAVPDFCYLLRDLNHYTDDQLRAQATAAFDLFAQLLLRHGRDPDLLAQLDGWRAELRAVSKEHGLRAIHVFLSYLGHVQASLDRKPVQRLLSEVLGETQTQEVLMTWHEQILAEGEARGEAKGNRSLFLTLLRTRFGEPSSAVKAAVDAATVDQLTTWVERVLQASSPEELLGLS